MSISERQPNVLFAIKEEPLLGSVREMLRNYGTGKIKHVRSMKDVYNVLYGGSREWDIIIADGALPNVTTVIKKARPEIEARIKFLLLMSNPTREAVMEAVQAGVNDFLAAPFPPALFEDKLDRLMGREPRIRPKSSTAMVYDK